MIKAFKLEIELVPETCWYSNLRTALGQELWDVIRKKAYIDAGFRCAICKIKAQLHCHEIWDYNIKTKIQALKGFTALCPLCHHVKHIGLARILAEEGKLDFDNVLAHFCKVNRCKLSDFRAHEKKAFRQWKLMSAFKWTTDLGPYSDLLPNAGRGKVGKLPVLIETIPAYAKRPVLASDFGDGWIKLENDASDFTRRKKGEVKNKANLERDIEL